MLTTSLVNDICSAIAMGLLEGKLLQFDIGVRPDVDRVVRELIFTRRKIMPKTVKRKKVAIKCVKNVRPLSLESEAKRFSRLKSRVGKIYEEMDRITLWMHLVADSLLSEGLAGGLKVDTEGNFRISISKTHDVRLLNNFKNSNVAFRAAAVRLKDADIVKRRD